MIREWGRSVGTAVFEAVGRTVGQAQERRPLPVDLLESEDAYLAVFDAPGVAATDLSVRFEANRIEVRLERFRPVHEGFETVFPGRGMSLDGHVDLPDGARVVPDDATATLKDVGELHVRVPKAESATDEGAADEGGADEGEGGDGEGDEGEATADE